MKETASSIFAEIDSLYSRWNKLYEDGGSDPFWSDGVNMNLVRNQIIYAKNRLEEFTVQEKADGQICFFAIPEIVDTRPLPPEVSNDYMAQSEKIRRRAEEVASRLEKNPLVLYLKDIPLTDDVKLPNNVLMEYYKNIAKRRRTAIKNGNLIEMRRGTNYPADVDTALRGVISVAGYFAGKETLFFNNMVVLKDSKEIGCKDTNSTFVKTLRLAKSREEVECLVNEWVCENKN